MKSTLRTSLQPFPQHNLSSHLLPHQSHLLTFLIHTSYDIISQTFELKHASYLNTKKGYPQVSSQKSQEIQRHFQIVREKLHIRIMRDDTELDRKFQRLEAVWYHRNVPTFHRYYVVKYLLTTFFKDIQHKIQEQQRLIKQQTHIYYTISKTINARQACLRQLKKHLAQLTSQDVHQYLHLSGQRFFNLKKKTQQQNFLARGFKLKSLSTSTQSSTLHTKSRLQFFSDNFNHLSQLTLYTLDMITKWKQYIYGLTHDVKKKRERVEYYFYDQNYLLKVMNDMGFLRQSFLNRFFQFPKRNDPFLLSTALQFQKRQLKTLENQLLKKIFMPHQENVAEIMNKMEMLAQQYKWNIRSRKNYDINVLKTPTQIQHQKKQIHQKIESPSKQQLKKIQETPPRKTKSLRSFRVRQQQKDNKKLLGISNQKNKILIEFKSSPKKHLNWLPVGQLKVIHQQQTSPLKRATILQKNLQNPLSSSSFQPSMLQSLKKQVIQKIRHSFNTSTPNDKTNHQALQLFISSKINQAIKGIFPYQPEKQIKKDIQLVSFRIHQKDIGKQINTIVKGTQQVYKDMQFGQTELIKKIDQANYVYFLKANIGHQHLATIVITLDQDVKQYKALKTLFIGFNDASQLVRLILQTVKFVQKYQNAYQMHFPFFLPLNNPAIHLLLSQLQSSLPNCLFANKPLYSSLSQSRFIFKRQQKNTSYYPNPYPTQIHFKLNLLHSRQKLFLEKTKRKLNQNYQKIVSYDYLLAKVVRQVMEAEEINKVKEKMVDRIRWKNIINMLITMDKHQNTNNHNNINNNNNNNNNINNINITFLQAKNISELNKQISKHKQQYPFMELTDTLKTNNQVHLASFSFLLKLKYPLIKAIVGKNSEMYYKISIKQQIQVKLMDQTKFYKLKLQDSHSKRQQNPTQSLNLTQSLTQSKLTSTLCFPSKSLVLFNASCYLSHPPPSLSTYLINCLSNPSSLTLLNQLFIPMLRYPTQYKQRQQMYLTTHRLGDLEPIGQELFVGEFFQYITNINMDNGIVYDMDQEQVGHQHTTHANNKAVYIKKPLGIAIIAQDNQTILYARIFA